MSVEFVIEVRKRGRPKKGEIVPPKIKSENPVGRPALTEEEKQEYIKKVNKGLNLRSRPQGIALNVRFFMAIDLLIEKGLVANLTQFCLKYSLIVTNINRTKRNPEKYQVPALLFSFLSEDYGVSAEWLLLGKGEMMKPNFKNED